MSNTTKRKATSKGSSKKPPLRAGHATDTDLTGARKIQVGGQVVDGKIIWFDEFPPLATTGERTTREVPGLPLEKMVCAQLSGDCLTNAHILDGDYAVIYQTEEIKDGQLAVVQPRHSIPLCKIFYREADGRIRLEARHPEFPPLYYQPNDVRIIGRVVRIERDFD
jgi:phage repressor protein C with HTH and peptisase S24 domain